MILHGIRKQVPTAEQPHFVPIFDNESAWRKLVNFSAPDDAYLIVTDPQGNVAWQAHGKFADDLYIALKQAAAKLLDSSAGTANLPIGVLKNSKNISTTIQENGAPK